MKISQLLLSASLFLLLGACSLKESPLPLPSDGSARLHIRAASAVQTKADPALQTADEMNIHYLDVFIFLSDNPDHVYDHMKFYPDDDWSFELPLGRSFKVYVMANVPEMEDVLEEQDITGHSAAFEDNTATSFLMTAPAQTVTMDRDRELTFSLERLCAKVAIQGNIRLAFSNEYLAEKTSYVRSAFLYSVPTRCYLINPRQVIFYQCTDQTISAQGFVSVVPALTFRNNTGNAVPWGGFSFYAFPNTAAEAASRTGTDNVTKLVICVDIGGELNYYAIGIPNVRHNTLYTISDVLITREGASSPDQYVPDPAVMTFDIQVADWVSGTISGSYNQPTTGGGFRFRSNG